jgi:hypothetical protein
VPKKSTVHHVGHVGSWTLSVSWLMADRSVVPAGMVTPMFVAERFCKPAPTVDWPTASVMVMLSHAKPVVCAHSDSTAVAMLVAAGIVTSLSSSVQSRTDSMPMHWIVYSVPWLPGMYRISKWSTHPLNAYSLLS